MGLKGNHQDKIKKDDVVRNDITKLSYVVPIGLACLFTPELCTLP